MTHCVYDALRRKSGTLSGRHGAGPEAVQKSRFNNSSQTHSGQTSPPSSEDAGEPI